MKIKKKKTTDINVEPNDLVVNRFLPPASHLLYIPATYDDTAPSGVQYRRATTRLSVKYLKRRRHIRYVDNAIERYDCRRGSSTLQDISRISLFATIILPKNDVGVHTVVVVTYRGLFLLCA